MIQVSGELVEMGHHIPPTINENSEGARAGVRLKREDDNGSLIIQGLTDAEARAIAGGFLTVVTMQVG